MPGAAAVLCPRLGETNDLIHNVQAAHANSGGGNNAEKEARRTQSKL